MTKAVNDATLNKAGDIYQFLIALKDCFGKWNFYHKEKSLILPVTPLIPYLF